MTLLFLTEKRLFFFLNWRTLNVAFVSNDPHATSTAGWRLITFPCCMPAWITPRGTSHSPKGSLICMCMKSFFLWNTKPFSSGRGFFLALSAAGAQGRGACTTRRKRGSQPGSATRARGVQSLEIWQVIAGLLSGPLEPTRPMQTQKCTVFLFSPIPVAVFRIPQQPSKAIENSFPSPRNI